MHKNQKRAIVTIKVFYNTGEFNRLNTKTYSKKLFIANETNKCN